MTKFIKYFKPWMNETVLYEKFSSRNVSNTKTYDTAVSLQCYRAGRTSRIINERNELVLSSEQLYIDGRETSAATMTTDDRFTVNSRVRNVQMIEQLINEDGELECVVIYL